MKEGYLMNTLLYLKESIANYTEDNKNGQHIYNKLNSEGYYDKEDFIKDLSEEDVAYLNHVLKKEMNYARNAYDETREKQLNEIYQYLY